RQTALDFGAQEFIDLENDALEDAAGVDLVFDVFGGDIAKRSAGLIRAGGTLVTIAGPAEARPADAWNLQSVPPSMLVIGGGATGVQVASIFNALGSQVQLFEAGPHILMSEDEDVAAAAAAFRDSGIAVQENFGTIESFEKTSAGVRMNYTKEGREANAEAALAIVAAGWVADTGELNRPARGVELNERKFVKVDEYMRTSAPHIFAAGDITGRMMLLPQALQGGFVAATNAVQGPTMPLGDEVAPTGSFTEPEYAQVGLTEKKARAAHNIVTAAVRFDSAARSIIDGRTFGFCKLVADRKT